MTFRRAIGSPTAEQQARQDLCRARGCIACIIEVCPQPGPSEIHHQTKSGRQIGQDESVCLCSWHHRSICRFGMTTSRMEAAHGPSLHRPRRFFERYGDNAEQLTFQNNLIAAGRKAA